MGQVEKAGFWAVKVGVEVPKEVWECGGCEERRVVAGFCEWDWDWGSAEVAVVVAATMI